MILNRQARKGKRAKPNKRLDPHPSRAVETRGLGTKKEALGDHVRSKSDPAMTNEVLGKILCHNICCVIASQCELGIEPMFWENVDAERTILKLPR